MSIDLKNEVLELISRKAEGEYWDFKQQWHLNNADLLHDIICMSNSPANRDCYIIIGVEDKTYNILGVSDAKRKNQQNVLDLLRQKPSWAGGYIPEVYVKTISIADKEIDVVVIRQSNNTPFYLLKDYLNEGVPIFKGAIYTRKGDTNTPKTETADLYDTELLWKRRFGLLYNPSQRAKFYLRDMDGWEGVYEELGVEPIYLYCRSDPDYTIYLKEEIDEDITSLIGTNDQAVNKAVGASCYYLFAINNVSYCFHSSGHEKAVLYYKNIPLFSTYVDRWNGVIIIVPPDSGILGRHYIQDSFRYLLFELMFTYYHGGYSAEAKKEMILRVIPVYRNDEEHDEFKEYMKSKGFTTYKEFKEKIYGEAFKRLNNTSIGLYERCGIPRTEESIAQELRKNKDLVINFASLDNAEYNQITEALRKGKMVVDWLEEWRNLRSDN